jgi:hypothetical protein
MSIPAAQQDIDFTIHQNCYAASGSQSPTCLTHHGIVVASQGVGVEVCPPIVPDMMLVAGVYYGRISSSLQYNASYVLGRAAITRTQACGIGQYGRVCAYALCQLIHGSYAAPVALTVIATQLIRSQITAAHHGQVH